MSPSTSRIAAYESLYADKTLVVKISGEAIASPEFARFVDDVQELIKARVRIVLVFGGGAQIDWHWHQRHKDLRPRHNGVGITSEELLTHAVIPAYHDVSSRLQDSLSICEPHFVDPQGVVSQRIEQFSDGDSRDPGLVGEVCKLTLPDGPALTCIGFLGQTESGQLLNVSSENIVHYLAHTHPHSIQQIILISPNLNEFVAERGAMTRPCVPLVSRQSLPKLFAHEHPKLTAPEANWAKLKYIDDIVLATGKVALTTVTGLRDEMLEWRGSGTLFFDRDQCQFARATEVEREIFDAVNRDYVEKGIFRPRTASELSELRDTHFTLSVKGSPLGGLSLVPRGENVSELCGLWSGYLGSSEVGDMLLAGATCLQINTGDTLFALTKSKSVGELFERHGFQGMGCVSTSNKFPSHTNALKNYLAAYDTSQRDPYVFVRHSN